MDPLPREMFSATATEGFAWYLEVSDFAERKKLCGGWKTDRPSMIMVRFQQAFYSISEFFTRRTYLLSGESSEVRQTVAVLYMTHMGRLRHFPMCYCFLVNLLNGL